MIARRSKPRRVSVNRDEDFLRFIKTEGHCILTVYSASHRCNGPLDPCHGPPNGLGSKGSDNESLPMCRAAHNEQTRLGWANFGLKHGLDREKEVAVWQTLYAIWKVHKSWPQP